jgi:hypothetical protein
MQFLSLSNGSYYEVSIQFDGAFYFNYRSETKLDGSLERTDFIYRKQRSLINHFKKFIITGPKYKMLQ